VENDSQVYTKLYKYMTGKNDIIKQEKNGPLYHSARYSIPQTASLLGIGTDLVRSEIESGKLKAEWRGKRMKCSQAAIDEYIESQRVKKPKEESDFSFKDCKILKEVPT